MLFRKICLLLLAQCLYMLAYAQSPSMQKGHVFDDKDYFFGYTVLPNGNTVMYTTDGRGKPFLQEFEPSGKLYGEAVVKDIKPTSTKNVLSGCFRMNGRFFIVFNDYLKSGADVRIYEVRGYDRVDEVLSFHLDDVNGFSVKQTTSSPNGDYLGVINGRYPWMMVILDKDLRIHRIVRRGSDFGPGSEMGHVLTNDGHFAYVCFEKNEQDLTQRFLSLVIGNSDPDRDVKLPIKDIDRIASISGDGIALNNHLGNTVVLTILRVASPVEQAVGPMLFQVYDLTNADLKTSTVIDLAPYGFGTDAKVINGSAYVPDIVDFVTFSYPISENSVLFGIPTHMGGIIDCNFDLFEVDLNGKVVFHSSLLSFTKKNVYCNVMPVIKKGELQLIMSIKGAGTPIDVIQKMDLVHSFDNTNTYYFSYKSGGKFAPGPSEWKDLGVNVDRERYDQPNDVLLVGWLNKKQKVLFAYR